MKRLRHPVRAIEEPFGKAGLVVAVLALVLALTGAAFAAAGLNGKQKKQVEKIAKKYAGKPGAPGAAGPAGPAGAKGDTGAAGSNGTNGTDGSPGAAGKSVVATNEPEGANCEEGGTKFEVEGSGVKHYACNGEAGEPGQQGDPGPEGSPWTAGGTLPPGATETGSWAFNGTEADKFGMWAPISFSIPLSPAIVKIKPSHVHWRPGGSVANEPCPGSLNNPKALPGELCIYGGEVFNATFRNAFRYEEGSENSADGASLSGAMLIFDINEGAETAVGAGSFAVTGCTTEVGKPDQCPAP